MLFKITISVILVLLFSDTEPGSKGAKSGRAGNKAYQTEEYDVAAGHYQSGITDAAPEGPSAISHGLFNNLGSALYRQGKFEDAQIAFDQAMLASASNEDMARAAYNAGNNAYLAVRDLRPVKNLTLDRITGKNGIGKPSNIIVS